MEDLSEVEEEAKNLLRFTYDKKCRIWNYFTLVGCICCGRMAEECNFLELDKEVTNVLHASSKCDPKVKNVFTAT